MRLLREWVRIILEGYKEDQETLIKKFPDGQNEIVRMNPKMINWFIRRFGNSPSVKETHPFEDCIPTVQKYEGKAAGLGQKYSTNEYFRSLVDRKFPEKTWSNLADYTNMTVDQMEEIMGLSERKKPRFDMEGNEPDRSDFLGKFGPWNLWMPSNRENSVKIAGYDPETLVPKTTWCTARVTDSNLFYNYAGKGIILFYVIKDNPQSDTDWLSVGFINGKPNLEGRNGGVTIDRANKGLKEEQLRSILGGYYDRLMTVMQKKTDKVRGEHPAKKKINEAAKSLSAYHNLIKGLGKEESVDLKLVILRQEEISPEILTILADDDNESVRQKVALNSNTPAHIQEKLSNDTNHKVRENIVYNPNTPAHILEKLSNDESSDVRQGVARNRNAPAHILEKLSDDTNTNVKFYVARSDNTPPHILDKLSNDENFFEVRENVAGNFNTPTHTLEKLSNDTNHKIREYVAYNPNTPAHILEKLSDDKIVSVREYVAKNLHTPDHILEKLSDDRMTSYAVAGNPNTPAHIVEKFADDDDVDIKEAVARNSATSAHVLEKFADDDDENIRRLVADNPNTPAHVLEKLSDDDDEVGEYEEDIDGKYGEWSVKDYVAINPNTPVHILEKLSKDKDFFVRMQVTRNRNVPARIVKNLLNDEVEYVRKDAKDFFIVTDPNTTAETLGDILVKSEFNKQDHHIAKHPNATPDILARIVEYGASDYISLKVISNPNTSLSTLKKLSKSNYKDIAEAAQQMLASRQQQLAELRKLIRGLI